MQAHFTVNIPIICRCVHSKDLVIMGADLAGIALMPCPMAKFSECLLHEPVYKTAQPWVLGFLGFTESHWHRHMHGTMSNNCDAAVVWIFCWYWVAVIMPFFASLAFCCASPSHKKRVNLTELKIYSNHCWPPPLLAATTVGLGTIPPRVPNPTISDSPSMLMVCRFSVRQCNPSRIRLLVMVG